MAEPRLEEASTVVAGRAASAPKSPALPQVSAWSASELVPVGAFWTTDCAATATPAQVALSDTSHAAAMLVETRHDWAALACRRIPAIQVESGSTAKATEKVEPRTCQRLTAKATISS